MVREASDVQAARDARYYNKKRCDTKIAKKE